MVSLGPLANALVLGLSPSMLIPVKSDIEWILAAEYDIDQAFAKNNRMLFLPQR
jgi:hypothetical protein